MTRSKAGSELPTPTTPTSEEVEAHKQTVYALAEKHAETTGLEVESLVSDEPIIMDEHQLRQFALAHQSAVKARRLHARQKQRAALRSIPRRVVRSIPRARGASSSRRPVAAAVTSSSSTAGAAQSSSRGDPSSSSDDPEPPQAPGPRRRLGEHELDPHTGLEQVGHIIAHWLPAIFPGGGSW